MKLTYRDAFLLPSVFLLLGCCQRAMSQPATISGLISHETGAAIVGVRVTLVVLASGAKRETTTDVSGGYQFSQVESGEYLVRVQQVNFETQERRIIVKPGESLSLNFSLKISEITETIDVTDMVNLLCTVTDKNGRLVTDLAKDDFLVKEDGKRQTLARFSRVTDLPLTVAILVDSS